MSEENPGSEAAKERSVRLRRVTDGGAEPQMHIIEAVAEFKGVTETELDALHPRIDDLVENLYSDPPSPAAQTELTFVYEDFRITLYQDGTGVFQQKPGDSGFDQGTH